MDEKLSLAEISENLRLIEQTEARILAEKILSGEPGLVAVTGQFGSGKTTTTLMIAHQVWRQGFPVTLLTQDRNFLNYLHLSLPQDWEIQYVDSSEQAWLEAIEVVTTDSSRAIAIDQLTYDNRKAILKAMQTGHWVFAPIDTPFVGIDVLSHLKVWQYSSEEILANVSGIVSQMLLPKLCENCAQLRPASLEETRLIYPDSYEIKELWYEQGCPVCENRVGGEYRYGRCASYEVLQIDAETKPLLSDYLEHNSLRALSVHKHFTMQQSSRGLVKKGQVGIQTYRNEVLQNPLFRIQHLWEQEQLRASRIQQMFGRFVTQHLAEELMSHQGFERIIEGEKRDVTCFFCDIRGFTTWSEQTAPTDIFTTLNQYFREMIDIVFQYEGTIDKFIGDSVMVIFGAPVEQIDHHLKAVNCAITIQKKVIEMNRLSENEPIKIGIGINSGEVVAGCLGSDRRMDYTILGDVVNTAARLESKAQPNQILLGETTYDAVKSEVSCRSMGNLNLKGKAKAAAVFEVIYSLTEED